MADFFGAGGSLPEAGWEGTSPGLKRNCGPDPPRASLCPRLGGGRRSGGGRGGEFIEDSKRKPSAKVGGFRGKLVARRTVVKVLTVC